MGKIDVIYLYALIIPIFAGLFTSLLGKYINHMRTTKLHVKRKKDFRPLVSVIIPTWNEEKVIENTIRMVEKSYYDNFEIIVIDDNSTDNTYKIVEKLTREFSNIKLLRKKGMKGKAQSINEAMEVAKGDLILFLDADARIPPEYIPTHVSCFSRDDIEMIVTGFEPYNFKPKDFSHIIQEIYFTFVKDVVYSNIFVKMIFMGNGVFFRRKTLEKVLPIDPTTLVDDFSIATELLKLGVKEYFSIYPWVEMQYATGLRELWKQHFRWYYGGFDEMMKRAKKGFGTFKAIYTFAFLFFFSPVILTALSLIFKTYLFLVILEAIIIYIHSTFMFSTLLDTERKVSILNAIVLPPFIMLFELSVMMPAIFLPLIGFRRKVEWYKVERDEA